MLQKLKNRCSVLVVCVLLSTAAPLLAVAETVVRAGDDITVSTGQLVDGDFYVSAMTAVMSGEVRGDMYAVGDTVTINGPIGADVSVVARTFALHASTADDVRVIAGEVVIADSIAGDVFVVGGTVDILSSAAIAGNVYLFAAEATIDAPVGGSIYGTVERLRIDSDVAGNVDITVPAGLTLGDDAVIAGNVTYRSHVPLVRGPQSSVGGTVAEKPAPELTPAETVRNLLVPLFVILFGVLSLYLLARPLVDTVVRSAVEKPLHNVLIGAGVLLLTPIVVILLFATVLGSLLGAGLLLLQLLGLVLAVLLSGVTAGWFVQATYGKGGAVSLVTVAVGTVAFYAVLLIPFVGVGIGVGFICLVLGSMARLLVMTLVQ